MTSTTARFQILLYSELQYPHKCSICGSFSGDNGKRYVDFGCWVEFYGTVYICTDCYLGSTTEFNVVPEAKFKAVQLQNDELQTVVRTLISENRELRNAIDHLRSSLINRPDPDPDDGNVVPSSSPEGRSTESGPQQEDSSRVPSGHDNATSEREAKLIRQNDGGGHQNIRDNDESIGLSVFDI